MAQSIQDAWRTYIQEGRNMRQESRNQIEKFVQRLVKEGQLRSDQVQSAVDDIQKRSEKAVDDFRKRVRKIIQEELKSLGVATKTDIDRLNRKITKLEKANKPAAKKSSSSRSTTTKKASSGSKSSGSKSKSSTAKRSTAKSKK